MTSFTRAIVRGVPKTLAAGITSASLGRPDYREACEQHRGYVRALESCGLSVTVLDADERYPDSVFVEDVAVLTERCTVLANPGAHSRRGEVRALEGVLADLHDDLERIEEPGTLDGGDVLRVGDSFYIGVTRRTNREGAGQLARMLGEYDFDACLVDVHQYLHLKTGIAHLGGADLLVAGELATNSLFDGFDRITVPPEEEYSANCIRVNDYVIVPEGFDATRQQIKGRGYEVIEVALSEFQKVDGGASCLSLRF